MTANARSQAALQYLITYAWMILILAVVLIAMYSLGLFGGSNLTPRAQPGSCYVSRPLGPGTTRGIGLSGSCGTTLPNYVATFRTNGYLNTTHSSSLNTSNFTIAFWMNPSGKRSSGDRIMSADYYSAAKKYGWFVAWNSLTSNVYLATFNGVAETDSVNTVMPSNNTWTQVVFTVGNGNIRAYRNGSAVGSAVSYTSFIGENSPFPFVMGGGDGQAPTGNYNGLMADVQLYNFSMGSSDVKSLFIAGIGAPPIDLTNLGGWWALNGNPVDYSGNSNNANVMNKGMSYTNQWLSGYSVP